MRDYPHTQILITRRPESSVYAGWWEIPGGKIDEGETPEQAVLRELKEEIRVQAAILGSLPSVEHMYDHAHVRIFPRLCRLTAGSSAPKPIQVTECRWVTIAEMGSYSFPEANDAVITALRDHLRNSPKEGM